MALSAHDRLRFFEIDGQPAVVVDGGTFSAVGRPNGTWGEVSPTAIENRGRQITIDEFAELRARGRGWGERLAENLNLNVLLEGWGVIGPQP